MNTLPRGAKEVPRHIVEAAAGILGDHSATAKALKDADARIALGEEVAFFKVGNMILVGPKPEQAPSGSS